MNTKICTSCKIELSLTDFNFKNKSKNIRQSQCRSCYNKRRRWIYQERDKDKILAEVAARKNANNQRYQQWKSTLSCKACGEDDPCCLDFHHLDPNQKDINVSQMVRTYSWDNIMAEVDKCIVVCKNCHCKIHKHGMDYVFKSQYN